MKEYYINNYITCCYPHELSKRVGRFGVLDKYIGERYSRDEIDTIIAELIIRRPYVSNSMRLTIDIMRGNNYYHMLRFKNYDYKKQKRKMVSRILFEKEMENEIPMRTISQCISLDYCKGYNEAAHRANEIIRRCQKCRRNRK